MQEVAEVWGDHSGGVSPQQLRRLFTRYYTEHRVRISGFGTYIFLPRRKKHGRALRLFTPQLRLRTFQTLMQSP